MDIKSKKDFQSGLTASFLSALVNLTGAGTEIGAYYDKPTSLNPLNDFFNPLGYLKKVISGKNPKTGEINAYNLRGIIAELAHDIQFKDPEWKKSSSEYDSSPYLTGTQYTTEGTMEHEAHSIIEPILLKLMLKPIWDEHPFYEEKYHQELIKDKPISTKQGTSTRTYYK